MPVSPNDDARRRASLVIDTRQSPYCRLRPVAIGEVALDDEFWAPRLRTTRLVTLRQQYEQCEQTGRIDNFRRAAGKKQIAFQGRFYNDSDVYKWLEATSFALAGEADPELDRLVDSVIGEIAAAQQPDGYLNTYFTFERAGERWADLRHKHELYVAGHLIQAAIAHHRATGKRTLLEVGTRFADLICRTFGPAARSGTDGHEEIEMALVELYRETGAREYLLGAHFFLGQRGQRPPLVSGSPYHQDHLPVREQREIVGHAVRATYLACGMADVAAETGDRGLRLALEALWESAYQRKAYLTGGLGARYEGEAFGADYELPNDRAYAETCAAIGGVMWNWRMLGLTGEARYADAMETALYNGVLAGVALDGRSYFYENPLADRGGHRRQPWFDCACCPPNLARMLLSLPGYLYSTGPASVWIHLYAGGALRTTLPTGEAVALRVETRYPWEGLVRVVVEEAPGTSWSLHLRLPGWCEQAGVRVNGAEVSEAEVRPSSYVEIRRPWRPGDVVDLDLAMPARQMVSHPRVLANAGRVALCRGPLVYCVEAVDHPYADVDDLLLPADTALAAEPAPNLLGGVVVLRGEALAEDAPPDGPLYRPATALPMPPRRRVALTAIPYYAWANRTPGPMQVWLRRG